MIPGEGKLTLTFTPKDAASRSRSTSSTSPRAAIAMGMYNLDDSIRDFARASLRYGLERG